MSDTLIPDYLFDARKSAEKTLQGYERIVTRHNHRVAKQHFSRYTQHNAVLLANPENFPDFLPWLFQIMPFLEKGQSAYKEATAHLFRDGLSGRGEK